MPRKHYVQNVRSISIVIPAFNEAARLPATISKVLRYCGERPYQFEVIVCDDGSTDGTAAAIKAFLNDHRVRLLRTKTNQGKGAAARRGILAAKNSYILLFDADMSTPIEEIEKLLPLASENIVLIGSRAQQTSRLVRRQAFFRERMGKIFNFIIRIALGFSLRDTQCGFKLFPLGLAQEVFQDLLVRRFAFDVEVLLKVLKKNIECREIAVQWMNSTPSRVHPIHDSVQMLIDVIRIHHRYGKLPWTEKNM